MTPYSTTEAVVIYKSVSQEQDLKVILYTKTLGKIRATAKGGNSFKSSRLGALQLGNIVKVHLFQKNDFYWLSEATTITSFRLHQKNLTHYQLLFLVLEITAQLTPFQQPQNQIYVTIRHLIDSINHNRFAHFIHFEIQLLQQLGFGVPSNINDSFSLKNYPHTQTLLKKYLEEIIEKPLHSAKLFQ